MQIKSTSLDAGKIEDLLTIPLSIRSIAGSNTQITVCNETIFN